MVGATPHPKLAGPQLPPRPTNGPRGEHSRQRAPITLVWFGLFCFGSSRPHLALRESGYPLSRCPGSISQPNKTERPYLTYESGFLLLHSFGGKGIRR